MTKEIIMPGPAFCAASEVSTKMPVPITAPMPSMVSWKAPSERRSPFFFRRGNDGIERLNSVEQHR